MKASCLRDDWTLQLALSQPLYSRAASVKSVCPHELLGNKGDAS